MGNGNWCKALRVLGMRPSGKFTYATSVNVNHTTQKAKTRERILSPLTQQPQVHGMRITQHLWTDKYATSVLFLARLVVVSRIFPTRSKDQIFSYFWMCIAAGTKNSFMQMQLKITSAKWRSPAVYGAGDKPLVSCRLVQLLEMSFERQLVC